MANLLNLLSVFVVIGGMFYRAVVFKSLWRWFLTPAFHLMPVSFWTSFGLLLLISLCSSTELGKKSDKSEVDQASERLSHALVILLSWSISLAIGWLIAGGHHHGA